MKQYDDAVEHLQAAHALYCDLGLEVDEASVIHSLAIVSLERGDCEDALAKFRVIMPVLRKAGHLQLYCSCLTYMAELYTKLQRWNTALRYAQRAQKFADKARELPLQSYVCRMFTRFYEAKGDYARALEYFNRGNEINETMAGSKTHRGIALQEFRSELRRLKQERAALRKKGRDLQRQTQEQARELAAKNMHLLKKQEFLEQLNRRVAELIRTSPPSKANPLRAVLQELQRNALPEKEWQVFEERFRQIDKEYITRLKRRYPKLSRSELKVCLLLKLNLATKEIAELLCVSSRTVEFHRNRIRKKLGVKPGDQVAELLLAV